MTGSFVHSEDVSRLVIHDSVTEQDAGLLTFMTCPDLEPQTISSFRPAISHLRDSRETKVVL